MNENDLDVFDHVEVTIRGYKGTKALSVVHCWLLTELKYALIPDFVKYKVIEMVKALVNEATSKDLK